MRKASVVALALVGLLIVPAPARAWGTNGHRLIMARAIDLLPPELKPFFERFREEIVIRVVDPDLWRNVGGDPTTFRTPTSRCTRRTTTTAS